MFLPNCRFRNVIKAFIVFGVIVVFALLVFYARSYIRSLTFNSRSTTATEAYRGLNKVEINGITCMQRQDIKTVLFIGLDTDGKIESSHSYNNEYNADFLLLATFNANNKECNLVEINRDTVADVQRLDIFGQKIDKVPMQLCLSYSFGDGLGESAANTKSAVSDLFHGLNIDYYIVLSRDATRSAVDYLHGIDVTMDNDYTDIDPSYVKGATRHMNSFEAMDFVSERMNTVEGTNTYRMQRQMCLLNNLVKNLQHSDLDYTDLYNAVFDYTLTDIDFAVFSKILSAISEYTVSPVFTPTGTSQERLESNEFIVDQSSVDSIALDVFYERI